MSAASPSPRWLALWLPRLATERLIRAGRAPREPFAVYAKTGNAFSLTAVCARAEAAGLHPGMALADARAMRPDVAVFFADEAADAALLDHIAAWCERFTPVVVLDPPHGLFLDVTGCTHLWGGEDGLVRTLVQRLNAQGFTAHAALAPTPGAAWACARFQGPAILEDSGDACATAQALAPLPVAALRLSEDADAFLKRLGLKTIGHILNAPRAPFAARAGQNAMLRLDQALGRVREALTPRRPPPPVFALKRLLEPLQSLDTVLIALEAACAELVAALDRRGMGATVIAVSLFGVDAKTRQLRLGLSRPERAVKPILRILRERLNAAPETIDAEFGIEAVRLDAVELAAIAARPTDLAPRSGADGEAEARLIDALAARLGRAQVGYAAIRDAHAPERANAWSLAPPDETPPPAADGVPRRPLRLFKRAQPIEALATVPDGPPLRFRWRRVLRTVARAEGPERIAPNWLKAPEARTRDYYRVEDAQGRRYWVYREGLFDEREPPRWFLHGLFG